MKSERQTQAPLTPEDVQKILSICSPRGLLVGGQALAFWADHLQVERPENLVSGVRRMPIEINGRGDRI